MASRRSRAPGPVATKVRTRYDPPGAEAGSRPAGETEAMLHVSSETGRLRRVLLHEPGGEVDRMVPAMMQDLLFDDILFGDAARDEHARFRRVLQLLGVETVESLDLLGETLEVEAARAWVFDVLLCEQPEETLAPLRELSPRDLASALVAGVRCAELPGAVEVDDLYGVSPLPNWCFQRDPQVVLGSGVVFCSMATPARHREALLARAVFRFHPDWRDTPVLYDPLHPEGGAGSAIFEAQPPHLEGGDVLVLAPDVLAVGLSERTNRRGVRRLARALARREGGPRWLLVVQIPRRRAYMHLDTLITPVDRDACLLYPPVILSDGTERGQVWEIDLHDADLRFRPCAGLLAALRDRGIDLEPIPCGGSDPVNQQREQWTDGANALALAPGVVTLYDRNRATAEELSDRGFRVVRADDVLLGREEVDLDSGGRVCILVPSHELSRARGGPHCLSHPLVRDAEGTARP
jgi:arginine deiminase